MRGYFLFTTALRCYSITCVVLVCFLFCFCFCFVKYPSCCCCCCCFSHSAYWLPIRKTTQHGGQSRSWSAEPGTGKREQNKKSGSIPPPHPPHCSFGENKLNHATHLQALRRSWSVSRPYKDTFGSSTRPMGVVSQNSTLPSAITSFPVSLLLSSTGDV